MAKNLLYILWNFTCRFWSCVFIFGLVDAQGQNIFEIPRCGNDEEPFLVRGDVLNCDKGDEDCPRGYICESIQHYTGCCRDENYLLDLLKKPFSKLANDQVDQTRRRSLESGITVELSCDRLPYRLTCSDGTRTQFTLRWYLKNGMCCSYPWGHCKDDDISIEPAIRTKADCESICIRGELLPGESILGSRLIAGGAGPVSGGGFQSNGVVTSEETEGTLVSGGGGALHGGRLFGIGSGRRGEERSLEGRPEVQSQVDSRTVSVTVDDRGTNLVIQKSCSRLPFRAVCPDGRKAQYTLRWYLADGMCCTYPWGHCPGQEILLEPAIRTEAQCKLICT